MVTFSHENEIKYSSHRSNAAALITVLTLCNRRLTAKMKMKMVTDYKSVSYIMEPIFLALTY